MSAFRPSTLLFLLVFAASVYAGVFFFVPSGLTAEARSGQTAAAQTAEVPPPPAGGKNSAGATGEGSAPAATSSAAGGTAAAPATDARNAAPAHDQTKAQNAAAQNAKAQNATPASGSSNSSSSASSGAAAGTGAPQAAQAPDAPPLVMETEDERLVRWDLTADAMTSNENAEYMEAKGNVVLTRGDEYLKADYARYYSGSKWVYLFGNVKVKTGRDEIVAREAEFDLRSRVGWLKDGSIFVGDSHAYVSGDHIDKHWGDIYTFKNAKVTTCDGDSPAWSMKAEEAVLEIDGYARLKGAAFQVKDQPLVYSPYFLVPVKTSRQTGLLMPQYGQSTTKGLYYTQPFFWAIDEHSDLTLSEQFMDKRGFMHGAEYRARPTTDSTIWLRGDWLWDKRRKLDPNSGEYSGDGLKRTNEERYWIRGMVDALLPDPAWRFKMDLDYVSDQYFLSEFKNDFGGFERSRSELFGFFNRELKEKDLNRVSGFLLTRDWERFSVALSSTYSQDQKLGHGNRSHSDDETVQSLPQFDAFLHKGRLLPMLPLEIEATAQAGYYYRKSGTRGARYEVIPRVTLPVNTRYGSIIASGALTQTIYDTERVASTNSSGTGQAPTKDWRTIPEFDVAAFTEFARVFTPSSSPLEPIRQNVGKSQWAGLRHTFQPRLEFRHRVNEDQTKNPWYSSEDRLVPRTEIVYSLTNILTVKENKITQVKDQATGKITPVTGTSYKDLLSLRLEQSYDFREASRKDKRDQYTRRPYGDIFGELTFSPFQYLSLYTRNNWSPYLGDFTRHQSGVGLSAPDFGSISLSYDRRKKLDEYLRQQAKLNYLTLSLATTSFGPFSASASYSYDATNTKNRETRVDIAYTHQCFKFIGQVRVEPQEESYNFLVQITGLGN